MGQRKFCVPFFCVCVGQTRPAVVREGGVRDFLGGMLRWLAMVRGGGAERGCCVWIVDGAHRGGRR